MREIKTRDRRSLLLQMVEEHFPEIEDEKKEEAAENLQRFLLALERLLED